MIFASAPRCCHYAMPRACRDAMPPFYLRFTLPCHAAVRRCPRATIRYARFYARRYAATLRAPHAAPFHDAFMLACAALRIMRYAGSMLVADAGFDTSRALPYARCFSMLVMLPAARHAAIMRHYADTLLMLPCFITPCCWRFAISLILLFFSYCRFAFAMLDFFRRRCRDAHCYAFFDMLMLCYDFRHFHASL